MNVRNLGSGHSGGSGGHPDAGGSDVGSGVSNTPQAPQEFNWALGLDLPPHDEEDPLFAGSQVRVSSSCRHLCLCPLCSGYSTPLALPSAEGAPVGDICGRCLQHTMTLCKTATAFARD